MFKKNKRSLTVEFNKPRDSNSNNTLGLKIQRLLPPPDELEIQ